MTDNLTALFDELDAVCEDKRVTVYDIQLRAAGWGIVIYRPSSVTPLHNNSQFPAFFFNKEAEHLPENWKDGLWSLGFRATLSESLKWAVSEIKEIKP